MKKITFLALLSVLTLSTIAQNKFGHINAQEILLLMPEYKTMNSTLQMSSTLKQTTLKAMEGEFQAKYIAYENEGLTLDAAIRIDRETELQNMQKRLQDFQQNTQNDLLEEEKKLMAPIEEKLLLVITSVAEEGGYIYIFNSQVFYYGSEKNDVSGLVKKKLGL